MTPTPEQQAPPPRTAVIVVAGPSTNQIPDRLRALRGAAQLIVVDSGSGQTEGLEEEFPDVRFIRLPRDFGLTKALNLGIRAASAEHVMLLSPRVVITPETIASLAEALDSQSNVGAVAPLLVGPGGSATAQVSDLPSASHPDPPLRPADPGENPPRAVTDAIMFRSFFLRALRQIDERYGEYGSSIELSRQVMRANKFILIHPHARAMISPDTRVATPAHQVDREVGTFRYLSKHAGFAAGFFYLTRRTCAALFSLKLQKAAGLAALRKIDGN